jgi:hypothetical protein
MLDFDPSITWKVIQEKLNRTTNPRHRAMLQELYNHARGEVEGDLERVMGTLSPNPAYRWVRSGPKQPTGTEEIREFYINEIFGGGRFCLEGNKDRIVVDDDTIITEGTMRVMQWGRDLERQGAPVDDPDAVYLMTVRLLIVWPFDQNGKIIGEESWNQMPESLVRVAPEDIPENFRAYISEKLKKAA